MRDKRVEISKNYVKCPYLHFKPFYQTRKKNAERAILETWDDDLEKTNKSKAKVAASAGDHSGRGYAGGDLFTNLSTLHSHKKQIAAGHLTFSFHPAQMLDVGSESKSILETSRISGSGCVLLPSQQREWDLDYERGKH